MKGDCWKELSRLPQGLRWRVRRAVAWWGSPFLEPQVLDRFFRKKVSRADRPISLRFYRTSSTRAHKKLDVQEPGLHPGPGPGAEFAGRAACAPQKNIRAESVFICFHQFTPNPDSTLRCSVSPVSTAGRRVSGVKIRGSYGRRHGPFSALSGPKLENTDFTSHFTSRASQLRASHLFFGFTAACLPIHPHPPNPAHVPFTYHASRIDRPEG